MHFIAHGQQHKVVHGAVIGYEPGALIELLRNNFPYKEYKTEVEHNWIKVWHRDSEGELWKYVGAVFVDMELIEFTIMKENTNV